MYQAHPVVACAESMAAALDTVADLDPAFLAAGDKQAALLRLTVVAARVEELRLRVLAAGQAAGDVAAGDGSRDAAAWLAHHARLDTTRARHLARVAEALDIRYAVARVALREERVKFSV